MISQQLIVPLNQGDTDRLKDAMDVARIPGYAQFYRTCERDRNKETVAQMRVQLFSMTRAGAVNILIFLFTCDDYGFVGMG